MKRGMNGRKIGVAQWRRRGIVLAEQKQGRPEIQTQGSPLTDAGGKRVGFAGVAERFQRGGMWEGYGVEEHPSQGSDRRSREFRFEGRDRPWVVFQQH